MDNVSLLRQLQDHYREGHDFLQPRKTRQVAQLILLNNLQRGDENISSTTMFSLMNRVHSSLYSDVLTVRFIPPEDTDYKKTETLNKLQQNDYREMDKSRLDYDWLWNTVFYGDGFCETLNWDNKRLMMVPEVINPLMMVYDPYFSEPDEWRYYGNWITKSGVELLRLQKLGLLESDFDLKTLQGGFDPDIWSFKSMHDQARMGTPVASESSGKTNGVYQLFEMKAYDENGDRYIYWTDKNFSKILRKKKLDLSAEESWPIVRKQIFREPNSSISLSVPDILEDKHRAKSVLYNLMYLAAKDEANPVYAYNPDVIKDVTQFLQRQIEQHIPMDDIERGVKRLNQGPAVTNSLLQFVNLLNNEATDAVGTTMVQPIMPRGKKSATGEALAQQIADMTASLQSKILGNGEKEFWGKWYQMHLKHMSDADEKVITLTSVSGVTFEKIKLADIETKYPPKIDILSQREADYKELVKRRDWMQIYPIIMQNMDPRSLANLNKFVFFPMFIKDSSTVDRIVPKSVDEIKAEQENDTLEQDKLPEIAPEDDDQTHLYTHYMAKKTSATWAHIFAHEKQLAAKDAEAKAQAQAAEQGPTPAQPQQAGTQMPMKGSQMPMMSNNTRNMTQAAVPLGQEMGDHAAKSSFSNMPNAK